MNWLKKISVSGMMILYHTTMDGPSILEQGFKTREQLGGASALGGGTDQAISFTTDYGIAKGIFDGFILMWQMANSPQPLEDIRNHLQSSDPAIRDKISQHISNAQGRLDLLLDGWKPGRASAGGGPKTLEELEQSGFKPVPNESGVPVGGKYFFWLEPIADKDIDDLIYHYVQSYLMFTPDVYNPLFYGTSPSNFRGMSRENIGIITAEVFIDPEQNTNNRLNPGDYDVIPSMSEIRVYNLENIHQILDFDPNPGDSPKMSSSTLTYQSDEGMHELANSILRTLYKHQDFLNRQGVAFDQLVGLVQGISNIYTHYGISIGDIQKHLYETLGIQYYDIDLLNYVEAKKKMEPHPDIREIVQSLPPEILAVVKQGELSWEDIEDRWYKQDQVGYERWFDQLTRNVNVDIDWWIGDIQTYKKELDRVQQRLMSYLGDRYGEEDLDTLADIVITFRSATEPKTAMNKNWLQRVLVVSEHGMSNTYSKLGAVERR